MGNETEQKSLMLSFSDGHQTRLHYLLSESSERMILILPALGVSARNYTLLMRTLHRKGWSVASIDIRGQGESSIRPKRGTDFGYREIVEIDFTETIAALKQEFGLKIVLLGHSLGGQLATLYAGLHPLEAESLILMTACSVEPSGWEGLARLKVAFAARFFPLLAAVAGYFPGERVGFGGASGRRLIGDWAREAREGRYRVTASNNDYPVLMQSIEVPVLALSFDNDFLAPHKAVDKLLEKMPRARVERKKERGFDHFSWLRRPQKVTEWIEGFLSRQ